MVEVVRSMEWKESVETALRMERTPLYIFRWETVEEAVRGA